MRGSTLVKLGANYIAEIEWEPGSDAPRLTLYRLEVSEAPSAEQARELAAALAPKSPRT